MRLAIRRLAAATPTAAAAAATKPPPATRAAALIDALPGSSLVSKTGLLTLGVGAATALISKEIYVLNEETLVLGSFAAIVTALVRSLRAPYAAWADEQAERMKTLFADARRSHATSVQQRIDDVAQLSDVESVTRDLFAMSREMAAMEAEAFELRQRQQLATEVRGVLDSWARYEAAVREREQRRIADTVLARVRSQLDDPRTQRQILAQCVADVERLAKQA